MLVTPNDIANLYKVDKRETVKFEAPIRDFQTTVLPPILGSGLISKLLDVAEVAINEYDLGKDYLIGDVVTYREVIYRAIANNTGQLPTANPSKWVVFDALNLLYNYVKPLGCAFCYRYVVNMAGLIVGTNTVGIAQSQSIAPLTPDEREQVLFNLDQSFNRYLNALKFELASKNYQIDGVQYQLDTNSNLKAATTRPRIYTI